MIGVSSMLITMSFETLDSVMSTVTSIVSDKMLKEEMKNVIVWVKGDKVRFSAYSGNISSATEIDAIVELAEADEVFVQLRAKDINDVIGTLKGLKKTVVEKVVFDIRENEAILSIFEAPIDLEMAGADKYYQETKFRITKPVVKEMVKREIESIDFDSTGTVLESVDVLLYVNTLYPTIQKEVRESTFNMFFGEKHIYTIVAQYAAIMENKLNPIVSGFMLPNTVVNFLKNFISTSETFELSKQPGIKGGVVLTVRVGSSIAVIKCSDMGKAYDITEYSTAPEDGIVIDKDYLVDVLKRMSLSSEQVNISVNIAGEDSVMEVVSKTMKQQIPIVTAKGEGQYQFVIRPELLSSVILSHASWLGTASFLYFEHGNRNNIVMAVKDSTNIWQTKVTGLDASKGAFTWK